MADTSLEAFNGKARVKSLQFSRDSLELQETAGGSSSSRTGPKPKAKRFPTSVDTGSAISKHTLRDGQSERASAAGLKRRSIVVLQTDDADRGDSNNDDLGPRRKTIFADLQKRIREDAALSRMILQGELSQISIFKDCGDVFTKQLADVAECSNFAEGHVIHVAGDEGTSLFCVLRGVLSVSVQGIKIKELHQGDFIGETFLFGIDTSWSYTLSSEVNTTVLQLKSEAFKQVLSHFHEEKDMFEAITSSNVDLKTAGTLTSTCEIFKNVPREILEIIDRCMVRSLYFPKATIMQDGPGQTNLVLLVHGSASVDIAGREVRTEQRGMGLPDTEQNQTKEFSDFMEMDETDVSDASVPCCFGELELLGLNRVQSVSVRAQTVCHVKTLHRPVFLNILFKYRNDFKDTPLAELAKDAQDAQLSEEEMPKGFSVVQDFVEAGCSQPFLDFLTAHLEARLYPQGKVISDFQRNAGKRCLHMLIRGRVTAHKDLNHTQTLEVGEVFGRMAALSLSARPEGSNFAVAAEHCCTQVLHQNVVVRALELFPDQRSKILMLDNPGRSKDAKGADFVTLLRSSPFFRNVNPAFVEDLSLIAIDRIFMPGDMVVHEGDIGDSMFILVSGAADVFLNDKEASAEANKPVAKSHMPVGRRGTLRSSLRIRTRIGHLAPGAICGELAMLGVSQTRTASIQASAMCVFWEVSQERAMSILDRYPEERDLFATVIVQNLDMTVPGRLLQLPLFKGFDRKFRVLLSLYCERFAFFPDHQVVREGEAGDRLWILNIGPAMLQKKGFTVKVLTPGTHFGCDNMLGINKVYIGSLVAVTMCHMLGISRSSYLLALEQYPAKEAHQELIRIQRAESKELKEAINRTAIRKSLWSRYQGSVDKSNSVSELTGNDLLRQIARAWHEYVKKQSQLRIAAENRKVQMESMLVSWREKMENDRRRVEERQRLKKLIQQNLTERGPIKTLKDEETLLSTPRHHFQMTKTSPQLSDEHQQLVTMLKEWPTPRRSPHYKLKVWGVVGDELLRQQQPEAQPSRILPLIVGPKVEGDPRPEQIVQEEKKTPRPSLHSCDQGCQVQATTRSRLPSVVINGNMQERLQQLSAAMQQASLGPGFALGSLSD